MAINHKHSGPALPDTVCTCPNEVQVEDFGDSIAGKYAMVIFNALLKSKALKKLHRAGKGDICVGLASQNLVEKFVPSRHGGFAC
jgi:hypothetical protein